MKKSENKKLSKMMMVWEKVDKLMRDHYTRVLTQQVREDADRVYTAILEALASSLCFCLAGESEKARWLLCADLIVTYTKLNDEIKRLEAKYYE